MNKVDLSTVLKSHKFDEMNVDTKLAEQYLESNTAGFAGNQSNNKSTKVLDSYGNIIHCDLEQIPQSNVVTSVTESKIKFTRSAKYNELSKLAMEIEKEADLFCQLEFLIRKIPIQDTKQSISQIVQYLQYTSAASAALTSSKIVVAQDSTPLLFLANTFQLLAYEYLTLIASRETAVVCYLFTQLCKKAGFDYRFLIGDNIPIEDSVTSIKLYSPAQVTGIITERSDIDSAVSALLDSDYHAFPITRIVVQESVYEEFKSIIEWKCKSEEGESKKLDGNFKSKCADIFIYKNKVFFLDFAGNIEERNNEVKGAVLVEAYRTTTELLSLINKSANRHCISLWASGISEANEIALNIDSAFIWINDCCKFEEPYYFSRVIFQKILVNSLEICDELIADLSQKQKIWSKISFTQRCTKVLDIINTIDTEFGKWFETQIPLLKNNNHISIGNDTMVLGFHKFDNVVNLTNDDCVYVFKALVNGSAGVITEVKHSFVELIEKLAEANVPIAVIRNNDSESKLLKTPLKLAHVKIIWTNFGTKFAN